MKMTKPVYEIIQDVWHNLYSTIDDRVEKKFLTKDDYNDAELDCEKTEEYYYLSPRMVFKRYPDDAKKALTLGWFETIVIHFENQARNRGRISVDGGIRFYFDLLCHADWLTDKIIQKNDAVRYVIYSILTAHESVFQENHLPLEYLRSKIKNEMIAYSLIRQGLPIHIFKPSGVFTFFSSEFSI